LSEFAKPIKRVVAIQANGEMDLVIGLIEANTSEGISVRVIGSPADRELRTFRRDSYRKLIIEATDLAIID
jgi:hypothetical protein